MRMRTRALQLWHTFPIELTARDRPQKIGMFDIWGCDLLTLTPRSVRMYTSTVLRQYVARTLIFCEKPFGRKKIAM